MLKTISAVKYHRGCHSLLTATGRGDSCVPGTAIVSPAVNKRINKG